jgi:hypothetical protein
MNLSISTLINPLYHVSFVKRAWFIFLFSIICFINIFSQTKVEISQPELKFINDQLIIKYDILGVKPDDRFKVQLEITDSTGKYIEPYSISGDIGDSISGGSLKSIVWDLAADSVFIDQRLFIEVIVEKMETPEKVVISPVNNDSILVNKEQEAIQQGNEVSTLSESEKPEVKIPVYKKNNFLLSMVFPGWGLTRLSNGKPYWLLGIAAVGCFATSIYFDRLAVSSYDDYKNSMDPIESDNYFNNAETQVLISNICAYSAIAIWVVDLGVVAIRANHLHKSMADRNLSYITFGTAYATGFYAPGLSVKYHF